MLAVREKDALEILRAMRTYPILPLKENVIVQLYSCLS
jgi:hypothetical protein